MILTAHRLREVFDYDPDAGVFRRKVATARCHRVGEVVGSVNHAGYLRIGIDGGAHMAHRLAWLYVHGDWPSGFLDHINCNKADNRIANLRVADKVTNGQNMRRAHSNNKSGFLGVHLNRKSGKWLAKIHVDGRTRWLGLHDTPQEAHVAYVAAKRSLHHGCTL